MLLQRKTPGLRSDGWTLNLDVTLSKAFPSPSLNSYIWTFCTVTR